MEKIVIGSSESSYKEAKEWKTKLENIGHVVLGHVEQISDVPCENFLDKYESLLGAAKKHGICLSHIWSVANYKRRTAKGFIWRYEDDESIKDYNLRLQVI